MSEQINIDQEQLRLALADRPPQTEEEFFLFAKACRFPCESCKGTGRDLSPGTYGDVPCQRCNGEGQTGFHFGRVAVCPGHVSPLSAFWGLFSQQYRHVFVRANRAGGKTRGLAYIEHLLMHFRQFTIAHMGGSEAQSGRGRDYFHSQVALEPWSAAVATNEPGQTKVQFHNGAKIEWLPSTEKQASGPHPELSVLDEVDEVDYNVRERFVKTPSGPRAMMIEASTWYGQEGTLSRIRKENPGLTELVWCLHGDSKIFTPEGDIPIRDLVDRNDVWVYGVKENKLTLCKARNIRLTRRNVSVIRVRYYWTARNRRCESDLIVTPDHKFLLKCGNWKEAQELKPEDRLVPFYRKRGPEKGRHSGWWIRLGGQDAIREHRFVFEHSHRLLKKDEIVHHIDHDPWNNHPSNLQGLSDSHHKSYHQQEFAKNISREKSRKAKIRQSRKQSGSPWNVEVNRKAWGDATPEARARRCYNISQALINGDGLKRAWQRFRKNHTEEELKEFFRQRAIKSWETRKRKTSDNHRVISVEPVGFADVYCMDVPGSENFIANGVVVHNCMWETIEKCDYDCDQIPLKDGTIGRCPLYEMEEPQSDGTARTVELCGGRLARLADGYISVPDAVANWERSNIHSRRVEHLCQEPTIPSGTRAYWAFSTQASPQGNVLPFNPEVRFDQLIDWTLDFNINPMSSFVIQKAPPEYGEEWWIVDEIYLFTASTEHVCNEFIRRYGVGGSMLSEEGRMTGIVGGLEIYGDWTGHNRSSVNLKSHYDTIREMLGQTPGFQQRVRAGDVAKPVDRLVMANQMFWDLKSGSKQRFLKIAPRCVNGVREFGIMPMKPGTMEKDKSDRVQRQLGLSHLGDALECWVWKRFPNGPRPGALPVPGIGGRREGQIASPFLGGKRLVAGGGSPWGNSSNEGPWR